MLLCAPTTQDGMAARQHHRVHQLAHTDLAFHVHRQVVRFLGLRPTVILAIQTFGQGRLAIYIEGLVAALALCDGLMVESNLVGLDASHVQLPCQLQPVTVVRGDPRVGSMYGGTGLAIAGRLSRSGLVRVVHGSRAGLTVSVDAIAARGLSSRADRPHAR